MNPARLLFPCVFLLALLTCGGCQKAGGDERLLIAQLSDLHLAPGDEASDELLAVIDDINAMGPDLVVVTGDLTHTGSLAELQHVAGLLSQLELPWLVLPGNHETNWSESGGMDWERIFGADFFFERRGRFLLSGLNTGPFMRMGDGHIRLQDIRRLSEMLSAAKQDHDLLLFFSHYPLSEGLDNGHEIAPILKNHGQVLAFCGHGHQLALLNARGIPTIMGRSLLPRGGGPAGYTLTEIAADRVHVFEKLPGQPLSEAVFSFSLTDKLEEITGQHSLAPPNEDINLDYPQIRRIFAVGDSMSISGAPLLLGDSLLIYGNSAGQIHAWDIVGQSLLWTVESGAPVYARPLLHSGSTPGAEPLIITGNAGGWLAGFSLKTGDIIWEQQTGQPVISSAVSTDKLVYQGLGIKGMAALKAADGTRAWVFEHQGRGLIQSIPVIYRNMLIFTAWDNYVYALDKHSGALLWKWHTGHSGRLLSPGNVQPVVADGKIFLVAPDRRMRALDVQTGQEHWQKSGHQVRESMGLSADSLIVYAKLMNDSILAVSSQASHFDIKWISPVGFGYDHNPVPIISSESRVYAATKNGLVMALSASDGALIWKHKVGHSSIIGMQLSNDESLWLTTADGWVVGLKDTDFSPL